MILALSIDCGRPESGQWRARHRAGTYSLQSSLKQNDFLPGSRPREDTFEDAAFHFSFIHAFSLVAFRSRDPSMQ